MSRLSTRPRANHTVMAAKLKASPGKWLLVGEYRASQSAETAANEIRSAYGKRGPSPYAPARSFQARTRLTEFGSAVEACYVGPRDGGDAT